MVIKLGIITTKFYEDYFQKHCIKFGSNCMFKIFTTDDLREVRDIYLMNKSSLDGFIVSSKFIYDSIGEVCIDPAVPVHVVSEDEALLYRGLFRLLIDQPDLNLSKVYIDFADVIDSFGEFKQYISNEGKPVDRKDIFLATEMMLENHINLWKEGKTNLSVTAFSHFVPTLEENGVKYVLISSKFQNVEKVFNDIINQITIIKLKERRTVVANISVEEDYDETSLAVLRTSTKAFLSEYGIQSAIQVLDECVSFYITNESFMRITSDLQNCSLLYYIAEHTEKEVKIGWGAGYDYAQAANNATKANRQAKAFTGSCSFYIDEDQHVVGPLQRAEAVSFNEQGNPQIIDLANTIGMNNVNLQKIVYFLEMRRTNKVSSLDIASCLGVTRKGANRILNRIEDRGYAVTVFEKRDSGKGRPQKYYELIFLDGEGRLVLD